MKIALHPIDRAPDREITLPDWTPTHEGTRLRAERVERREGLRECAERIGLSAAQLSALESGIQTLSAEEWVAVLEAGRR